jgi:Nucleoside-diphosphate-sugar epimerases
MSYFKNKKVLVAGGTGMIGIQLVNMLLELGATVQVASLDAPDRCPEGAKFMALDMTKEENCVQACKGVDHVFNLLGVKASPATAQNKPASHFITNMLLQLQLMEAARKCDVASMLFTSSVGVYAPAQVLKEDDVWTGFPSRNDWYGGWAKRMGELQIEGYRKEYGWDRLTVVRPTNVYGPWDCFHGEHAMVVPSLIRKALEAEGELPVWGDGSPRRDFIFSRDVAAGMIQVVEKNPSEPVNLGSGNARSIKDLVEIIVKEINPSLRIAWDVSKPAGDALRCMDTTRAESLGIRAATSLEEGVAETIEWYRTHRGQETGVFNAYK